MRLYWRWRSLGSYGSLPVHRMRNPVDFPLAEQTGSGSIFTATVRCSPIRLMKSTPGFTAKLPVRGLCSARRLRSTSKSVSGSGGETWLLRLQVGQAGNKLSRRPLMQRGRNLPYLDEGEGHGLSMYPAVLIQPALAMLDWLSTDVWPKSPKPHSNG